MEKSHIDKVRWKRWRKEEIWTRERERRNNPGRERTRHRGLLSDVTAVVTVWSRQSQHTKTTTFGQTKETLFAMSDYNDWRSWRLKNDEMERVERATEGLSQCQHWLIKDLYQKWYRKDQTVIERLIERFIDRWWWRRALWQSIYPSMCCEKKGKISGFGTGGTERRGENL